jgi:type III secretion protein R
MYQQAGSFAETRDIFSEASVKSLFDGIDRGKEPLRRFLAKQLAVRLPLQQPQSQGVIEPAANPPVQPTASTANNPAASGSASPVAATRVGNADFQVLIPAFVTSQLKEAFEAGFLVFVPFIIIDMVIANVLLAMGMSMLSPSVISLPFKLLLFVLVDGWFLIVRSLVLSYL